MSKSGETSLGEGGSIIVTELDGRDNFKIEIFYVFITYDFKTDFYNRTSELNLYGMRIFGDCY